MNLSPLIRHRLAFICGLLPRADCPDTTTPPASVTRQRAVRVAVWECPHCTERYDDEDDAEDCCQGRPPKAGTTASAPADSSTAVGAHCPVCGELHADAFHAADCCLWRDIPAHKRFRIAARVEASREEAMTAWLDAIRAEGFEL